MNNQEIFDLIACFDRSGLTSLRLTRQDVTIEVTKGGAIPAAAPAPSPAPVPAPAAAPASQPEGEVITAPMVGTCYAAPAPHQPPFVQAGDRVARGQTLCLMEAMKMMSEVTAPCDCVIREVLLKNGELAEFGQPLFRYQPC